jgi:hypothetical protein
MVFAGLDKPGPVLQESQDISMAEVTRPKKALVEIINEVAISGAEKTLQEAQEAFGKINVTNPEVPSEERDLALLRLDVAKAGLITAKGHLKFAECLADHHKLSPAAGVNLVEVFEDEDELRKAVLSSFRFEVEVGRDGTMTLHRLLRETEAGVVVKFLPNPIEESLKFHKLPNRLDWLKHTNTYSHMHWWREIRATYGLTYFHRDPINPLKNGMQSSYFRTAYPCYKSHKLTKLPRAAFVRSTGHLYAETPSRLCRTEVTERKVVRDIVKYIDVVMGSYEETQRSVRLIPDLDGSSLFKPYLELIQADIPFLQGDSPIDLTGNTQGPLAKEFAESVRRASTDLFGLKFELSQVDQQEIYQRIGIYWEKLVSAPYTETTGKAYNSLRQACRRNNDAVDICATLVKGQFKFTVSRDGKEWLVGQVYCPEESFYPVAAANVKIEKPMHLIHRTASWHGGYQVEEIGEVISVGPCKFLVGYANNQWPTY